MNGKQFSSFPELKASGTFVGEGNDGGVPENEENGGENERYSTISYNSSKKEDPENGGNQKNFKTYYDKNRKPKVYEDLYSDYETEEKKPEDATSITTIRPRKTKEESYLPSQEYLAHLKNKENKIQRSSRSLFSKLFPGQIKSTYSKELKLDENKTLDQMGFVINKKDLELQEVVYGEVAHWKNELHKKYEDKKKNTRNKKELREFNKNPYDWAKVALSNQLTRLRNELEKIENKDARKSLREKISHKEKILNAITNAIQKNIPLQLDADFTSNTITFNDGGELNTEIATEEINKAVEQESVYYSIAGVVLRGRDRFVVLKNEKGERVELKMEDAEKLARETSIDFIKAKEKEKKLEGIQINDIVKIRTGGLEGKRSSYKITKVEKGKIFFEETATNQKGSMSIEDMRSFLMDKNKDFVIEKSEEYKNKEELKKLEYFNEVIEELKIRQTIGRRDASPEQKIKVWREQLTLLGFGNVEIRPAGQVEDNEKIEAEKKETVERQKIMREVSEIIRKNGNKIDKIVIHGYTYEDEEQNLNSHWDADLDTRGSLFLLDLAKIDYTVVEKTHKGTGIEPESGKVVSYEDVGGRTLGIERKNGGIQIYNDHHQRGYSGRKDSATKQRYQQLFENGFIKREPWLDNLVDFINQQDNLTYVEDSRFKGNEKYFKNKFPSSIFALQKEVDFGQVVKWFKEGKDPFNPNFSDRELEQKVMYKKEMIPLKFIIGEIQKKVENDLRSFEFAKRKMKERGIKEQTNELGKVIYNFPDFQTFIGKTKGKVVNKFNYPFLIIKAMGYDTYVSYSELTKKYFINNSTHDLTYIDKELLKKVPESIMVNGVMILPPRKKVERGVINEEEFLKTIKLKE